MDSRSTAAADSTSYNASPWPASLYPVSGPLTGTSPPHIVGYYAIQEPVYLVSRPNIEEYHHYHIDHAIQSYNRSISPGRGNGAVLHNPSRLAQLSSPPQSVSTVHVSLAAQQQHQSSFSSNNLNSHPQQQHPHSPQSPSQLRSQASLSSQAGSKQVPKLSTNTAVATAALASNSTLSSPTPRSTSKPSASPTLMTPIAISPTVAKKDPSLASVSTRGSQGPGGPTQRTRANSALQKNAPSQNSGSTSKPVASVQPVLATDIRDEGIKDRANSLVASKGTNKNGGSNKKTELTGESKVPSVHTKMPSKGQNSTHSASGAASASNASSSSTARPSKEKGSGVRNHGNNASGVGRKTPTVAPTAANTATPGTKPVAAASTSAGATAVPPSSGEHSSSSNAELLPPKASLANRSSHLQSQHNAHSSSVPSTPNQHGRNFSFESRDPSPNAGGGHSPRSSYSETNPSLPSLRPLPPREACRFETSSFHFRRRIPYSRGSDPLEKVDQSTVKSELTPEEDAKITDAINSLYNELLPKPEVEARRTELVNKLEHIFNEEWPGHDIKVHLFGSSGNLLCSDDSDVDICITTSWKELEDVCKIADLLSRKGMEKVVCISAAKVPIVKMWDPKLQLACDMNVNNTLALDNTRMVRTYVELDPRVRPLAMIIKHWTRRRVINDAAFGGTLSSYTWICLIIAFLQLRTPKVVPTLHDKQYPRLPRKGSAPESPFADDVQHLRGFGKNNKSSVGSLLFQFFLFYGHQFDYSNMVLSVRQGVLATKTSKNWQHAPNNSLCVEEPFNTSRNLGNTVDEYSFVGLHEEIRRAFDLVSAGDLEQCCEQFVFPKEEERPIFTRPAPRPAIIRSSSQSHGGRGRGGRRGQHNSRNNGSNRRSNHTQQYDQTQQYASAMLNPYFSMPMEWIGNGSNGSSLYYSVVPGPMQPGQQIQAPQLVVQGVVGTGVDIRSNSGETQSMANGSAMGTYPVYFYNPAVSQAMTSNTIPTGTVESHRLGPQRNERSQSQPASRPNTSQSSTTQGYSGVQANTNGVSGTRVPYSTVAAPSVPIANGTTGLTHDGSAAPLEDGLHVNSVSTEASSATPSHEDTKSTNASGAPGATSRNLQRSATLYSNATGSSLRNVTSAPLDVSPPAVSENGNTDSHGDSHGLPAQFNGQQAANASVSSTPRAICTPPMAGSPTDTPSSAPPTIVHGSDIVPPKQQPLGHMMEDYLRFGSPVYPMVSYGFMYQQAQLASGSVSADANSMMFTSGSASVPQHNTQTHNPTHSISSTSSGPSGVSAASSQPASGSLAPPSQAPVPQGAPPALSPVYEHNTPALVAGETVVGSTSSGPSAPSKKPEAVKAVQTMADTLFKSNNKETTTTTTTETSKTESSKKWVSSSQENAKATGGRNNGGRQSNGNNQPSNTGKSSGKKGRQSNESNGNAKETTSSTSNSHDKDKDSESGNRGGHGNGNHSENSKWQKPKNRKKSSANEKQHGSQGVSSNAEVPPKDESERKGG